MIVGGGTVGIELTGELANAFPGLDITNRRGHGPDPGYPRYTDALRNEISEQLATLGVRVVTGSELAYLPLRTSATSRTSWSKLRRARSSRPTSGSSATAHAPTPGS